MAFLFTRIFRYVIAAVVAFSVTQWALKNVDYTVSPRNFRAAADKAAGKPVKTALTTLVTELRGKYGKHILPDSELQWIHLNINGLNMRTMLLHASTTEYVAVFSTPFAAQGFVGSHWMNQTCTVLGGRVSKVSMSNAVDAEQGEQFDSGSNFRLNSFEPTFLQTEANSFVLCYGRGFVPLSTIHVKTGTLLVGGDVVSFARFWWIYTQSATREAGLYAFDLYNMVRRKYIG